jgi:hypothetical protein
METRLLELDGTILTTAPAGTANAGGTIKAPFRVVDAGGKTVFMVQREQGGGAVSLLNSAGKSVAYLGVTDAGAGYLQLWDKTGQKKLVELTGTSEGGGVLTIFDKTGQKDVAHLDSGRTGSMGVLSLSRAGRPIVFMGARFDCRNNQFVSGSLKLYNASGKVVFDKP